MTEEDSVRVSKVREGSDSYGFNAEAEKYENLERKALVEAGSKGRF